VKKLLSLLVILGLSCPIASAYWVPDIYVPYTPPVYYTPTYCPTPYYPGYYSAGGGIAVGATLLVVGVMAAMYEVNKPKPVPPEAYKLFEHKPDLSGTIIH